jgi:hypothetical protein
MIIFLSKEITCCDCPNPMEPKIDIDNSEKVRKKGVV